MIRVWSRSEADLARSAVTLPRACKPSNHDVNNTD